MFRGLGFRLAERLGFFTDVFLRWIEDVGFFGLRVSGCSDFKAWGSLGFGILQGLELGVRYGSVGTWVRAFVGVRCALGISLRGP